MHMIIRVLFKAIYKIVKKLDNFNLFLFLL